MQHRRLDDATGAIPALRADFPGEAAVCEAASARAAAGISAGSGVAGAAHSGIAAGASLGRTALEHGPAGDRLRRAAVHRLRGGAVVQLSPRHDHDSAAATEVGDPRNDSGHRSLHAVLCDPLPQRHHARSGDEAVGSVTGTASADLRLCHLPLSLDGRRSDLEAGGGLRTRRRSGCRHVFCTGGGRGRTGAFAETRHRTGRADDRDCGYRAAVRSRPQLDSGSRRPLVLPHGV